MSHLTVALMDGAISRDNEMCPLLKGQWEPARCVAALEKILQSVLARTATRRKAKHNPHALGAEVLRKLSLMPYASQVQRR